MLSGPTTEALLAARAHGELGDLDEADGGDRGDHELGDPHTGLDGERRPRIGVQEHDATSAVARVDQARRVDDADAVTCREARAG
jgi:hypothetical protein